MAKKETSAAKATPETYTKILAPVITEKSTNLSQFNQIVFRVPLDAKKPDIKKAVEAIWNVKVKAVNTIRNMGKTKRFKGHVVFRSDSKKAIITLAEGQTIDIGTGV